jgi:hypothetical protein
LFFSTLIAQLLLVAVEAPFVTYVFAARTQHRGPQGHRRYFVVVGVVHLGPRLANRLRRDFYLIILLIYSMFSLQRVLCEASRRWLSATPSTPSKVLISDPIAVFGQDPHPRSVGAVRLQTQGGERSFNGLLDCFWKTLAKEGVLLLPALVHSCWRSLHTTSRGSSLVYAWR